MCWHDENKNIGDLKYTSIDVDILIRDLVADLLGYMPNPKKIIYPEWIRRLAFQLLDQGWRKKKTTVGIAE